MEPDFSNFPQCPKYPIIGITQLSDSLKLKYDFITCGGCVS